jgi:hypothetical protein
LRVLFLDCDGVLNDSDDLVVDRDGGGCYVINREKIRRLQTILDDTGAKVVLCSSWRLMEGGREFLENYCGIPILDITPGPYADKIRGHDVQEWLDAHPEVDDYVILEDETDCLPHQLPHLVVCDPEVGLTETMAYRATYILKNGPRYHIERNDNPFMRKVEYT